jgi:hypothetical protein
MRPARVNTGASTAVEARVQQIDFRTLVYRYFFFGWLFRDVTRGTLFERAAAWRHNREQARWLPTYMWRWLGWGLAFYGLGGVLEGLLDAPTLSMLFYVPGALSVPVNAVIAAAWIGLKALPGPL